MSLVLAKTQKSINVELRIAFLMSLYETLPIPESARRTKVLYVPEKSRQLSAAPHLRFLDFNGDLF